MADKYNRLACLVVDVCPEPLRELFLKLAKSDAARIYIDLRSYLALRQHEINQLKTKKVIRNDQYNLVFPQSGSPNLSDWDVTLLVALIKNIFSVQPVELSALDEIKDVRNGLQHQPNTSTISDKDYDTYWGRLETAAKLLARQASGNAYESKINDKIIDARGNNMPNLGNALRSLFEEKITVMEEDMKDMKKEMTDKIQTLQNTIRDIQSQTDTVAENCIESAACLRSSTVTKTGPNGEKLKRLKAVDNIVCGLMRQFQLTMNTELPDTFIEPAEIADIRRSLRDKHHVVVTGFSNSKYLETALFLIKSLNYNITRCVEINNASEWRHIDRADTDLVLIRDPFGALDYDENKALSMFDIFDSVLHAVTPKGDEKVLDLIIVTEFACLCEITKLKEHVLLEEVVKVFDKTSESQPADLTSDPNVKVTANLTKSTFARQMTDILLSKYSVESKRVDQTKLKEAKETLKRNKMLVISATTDSWNTLLAVAIAGSYQQEEVLMLSSPDDVRDIDFKRTSLVIIDQFTGRYGFDEKEISRWYLRFHQLHEAATARKLNVIVTCEPAKLQRCVNEVGMHPLLSIKLNLTESPIHVKEEALHGAAVPSGPISRDLDLQAIRSVPSIREYSIRRDSDEVVDDICGFCILPDGQILLVGRLSQILQKLDCDCNVISSCKLSRLPSDVCYIGNNIAVVTSLAYKKLTYVNVTDMKKCKTLTLEQKYGAITYHNDKLYALSSDTLYIHTLDSNRGEKIYRFLDTSSGGYRKLAVSYEGQRIYIADCDKRLMTVDNFGNVINSLFLPNASGVCVDERGNVWVGTMSSGLLYQVSADGASLLDAVSIDGWNGTASLGYDTERSSLIVLGSDKICIVGLNL